MLQNLIDCLKGLFGIDDADTKKYLLCHTSCLCEGGDEDPEPICTDYHIVQRFCPKEIFGSFTSSASSSSTSDATSEALSSSSSTTTTTLQVISFVYLNYTY